LCSVEIGWNCTETNPSDCNSICGDGYIRQYEECDDGNLVRTFLGKPVFINRLLMMDVHLIVLLSMDGFASILSNVLPLNIFQHSA
jgi:hypothetical protein